jgi:hypothetical protein
LQEVTTTRSTCRDGFCARQHTQEQQDSRWNELEHLFACLVEVPAASCCQQTASYPSTFNGTCTLAEDVIGKACQQSQRASARASRSNAGRTPFLCDPQQQGAQTE